MGWASTSFGVADRAPSLFSGSYDAFLILSGLDDASRSGDDVMETRSVLVAAASLPARGLHGESTLIGSSWTNRETGGGPKVGDWVESADSAQRAKISSRL